MSALHVYNDHLRRYVSRARRGSLWMAALLRSFQHMSSMFQINDICLDRKGLRDLRSNKKKTLLQMPGALNSYVREAGFVSAKDRLSEKPPEHLPKHIHAAFVEGAKCMTIGCFNAAAAMFRLCLDFATKEALAKAPGEPPRQVKFSLGHRLPWLFDNGLLPTAIRELSDCVKEDGNDGAHDGTLSQNDADDLHDFTVSLLERLYTEPARLEEAKRRREERRK